jgi:hypothetical protein
VCVLMIRPKVVCWIKNTKKVLMIRPKVVCWIKNTKKVLMIRPKVKFVKSKIPKKSSND